MPHRKDDVHRVLQAAGVEADGQTIFGFAIPLHNDDSQDKELEPESEIPILLAYHGSSDSLTARHTNG
jgi:hypothetical protein